MRHLALAVLAALALPLRADLASQIQSANGWVGYAVPIVEGRHFVCSWDNYTNIQYGDDDMQPVSSALIVLYEVEDGKVVTVRSSSPECRATRAAGQPCARFPPNIRRTWNMPSSTRFGPARMAP